MMMSSPNVYPLRPRGSAETPEVTSGFATLIVDDEAVYRDGLKALLCGIDGVKLPFQAATVAEAVAMARTLPPLSLIVAQVDGEASANTIARLRHHFRGTPIVAVAHRHDRASVAESFRQGAQACLNRVTSRDVTRMALTLALSGECYVPADVCGLLFSSVAPTDAPDTPVHPALGPRQAEVLRLLLEGRTNKEIARDMGVLESTVKSHVKAVLHALGAGNRTQAVIIATRLGWRPKKR
jgi:two-component system, NarL family, nitrate/nitrite response regulator NarL